MYRVRGEPARSAIRQVHHIEPIERAEREPLAVGRRRGISDLAHQHGAGVHAIGEADQGAELLFDLGRERDFGHLSRGDRDAVDLAAVGDDDRLVVGCEREAGIEITGEAGLFIVAGHRIDQPLLVARLQIAQAQSGLGIVARGIDQPLPVRGQHRPHGAAVQIGLQERPPLLPVIDRQLPQRILEIVAESATVA